MSGKQEGICQKLAGNKFQNVTSLSGKTGRRFTKKKAKEEKKIGLGGWKSAENDQYSFCLPFFARLFRRI